jgi:glycosyltransferase involved in cell wall biosynthesis
MRIAFALPGLHRTWRGAEVAFTSVGAELARRGHEVTLIGSGPPLADTSYRFLSAKLIQRERFERFPSFPAFRNETSWEEASFVPSFLGVYRPQDYDATLACSYPFLNWTLRARRHKGRRPAHVFVTQNGDWPARANNSEYRFFGCDGIVGINPDFYEACRGRFASVLIPNGVDLTRFRPGASNRALFGLPDAVPLVLMVSALIESKDVGTGIEAVSRLRDVHLVVAGDGPLRDELREHAQRLMPGRYHNLTTTPNRMPDLYRSADLFMHLAREEAFGNVFVEAMASGLTTVSWDLPRTRWITGPTGRLVPEGDLASLAGAIESALGSGDELEALSRRAEHFSWERIGGRYEEFIAEVVARRSKAQG